MKTQTNGRMSAFKQFVRWQWEVPSRPDNPADLPGWHFIRVVKPVANVVGVFFCVLTILGVTLLLVMGCDGTTAGFEEEPPGMSVWLGEDGLPRKTVYNPTQVQGVVATVPC